MPEWGKDSLVEIGEIKFNEQDLERITEPKLMYVPKGYLYKIKFEKIPLKDSVDLSKKFFRFYENPYNDNCSIKVDTPYKLYFSEIENCYLTSCDKNPKCPDGYTSVEKSGSISKYNKYFDKCPKYSQLVEKKIKFIHQKW